MLDNDRKAAEAVPNVGYRIVPPADQMRLAVGHQRRSQRSITRGHRMVTQVDLRGLSDEARAAFEVTGRALGALAEYHRRLDVRQAKLEEALDGMTTRQERADGELASLRERLERLERSTE